MSSTPLYPNAPTDTWGISPTATELRMRQEIENVKMRVALNQISMSAAPPFIADAWSNTISSSMNLHSINLPIEQELRLGVARMDSGYLIAVRDDKVPNKIARYIAGSSLEECLREILAEVVARKLEK